MKGKKDKDDYLQAIATIDLARFWIEIRSVPETRVDLVTNQVGLAWLTIYLLSSRIIVVRSKVFLIELKSAQETHKPTKQ